MIGSRKGFKGSDTQACSGTVLIGSLNPAIRLMSELEPATAWSTSRALTSPRSVRTPVTRPFRLRMSLTVVFWWSSTPRRAASAA